MGAKSAERWVRVSHKAKILVGAKLVAVVLVMASAAFACGIYRGRFIVVGSNGGTVTAIGAGAANPMSWCTTSGSATASSAGVLTMTITAEPSGTSCPAGAPFRTDSRPGSTVTYSLNFYGPKWATVGPVTLTGTTADGFPTTTRPLQQDQCDAKGTPIGSPFVLDGAGSTGSKTLTATLPSNLIPSTYTHTTGGVVTSTITPGLSYVCYVDTLHSYVNTAPLLII